MLTVAKTKIVKSVVLAVLVSLVLVPPFYRSVFESKIVQSADELGIAYVDDAFNRALVSFALARTTNAIISVIQDSEIDIAPAGIGVTIAIGEALDPINDMIERFSWVMLVSLVSLGMQKMLIEISPWVSFKMVLLPALCLLLIGLWSRGCWQNRFCQLGTRLIFVALVLRFCIPAVAVINDQIYALFLDQHYSEAVSGIEHGNNALRKMDPLSDDYEVDETAGIWDGIKKKAEKVGEVVDLQHRVNRMKARLAGMIENLLKVIAVFILNTIILPIGLLWLLARLFRSVTGNDSLLRIEQLLSERIAGGGSAVVLASEAVHPGGDGENLEVDEQNKDVQTDQREIDGQ